MDWIGQVQNRDRWLALVNAVMNRRVSWSAGNLLSSWWLVTFSPMILLPGIIYLFSSTERVLELVFVILVVHRSFCRHQLPCVRNIYVLHSWQTEHYQSLRRHNWLIPYRKQFLISNLHRFLNVVFLLLCEYPTSKKHHLWRWNRVKINQPTRCINLSALLPVV
jgi:hypothetical protein